PLQPRGARGVGGDASPAAPAATGGGGRFSADSAAEPGRGDRPRRRLLRGGRRDLQPEVRVAGDAAGDPPARELGASPRDAADARGPRVDRRRRRLRRAASAQPARAGRRGSDGSAVLPRAPGGLRGARRRARPHALPSPEPDRRGAPPDPRAHRLRPSRRAVSPAPREARDARGAARPPRRAPSRLGAQPPGAAGTAQGSGVTILVGAFLLLAVGACATAVVRPVRAAPALAAIAGGLGCALGVVAGVAALARGAHEIWTVAWSAPIGSLAFGIDPLSAFFLVCVFAVGGLSLLYAAGYFAGEPDARSAARAAAWLQLLVAAMAGVVIARDAISFLVAWEAMFLASYFLVTFDDRDERVRSAGFVYLVASHASVVLLLVFFGTLARHADGLAFAEFAAAPLAGRPAMAAFAVALAGFGIKAGLWPLHGW